jgi:hypothetical protein
MVQLISPRQAYGMKSNAEEDDSKEQQSVSADSIDWLMRGAERSPDNTMVRFELSQAAVTLPLQSRPHANTISGSYENCDVQDVAKETGTALRHGAQSSSKRQKLHNYTSFSQLLCAAERYSSGSTNVTAAEAAVEQRSLFAPHCSTMSNSLQHHKLSALAAAADAASSNDNDISDHVSSYVSGSALSLFAPAIAAAAAAKKRAAAAFTPESSDSGSSSSSSSSNLSPVPLAEQQPLWLPTNSGYSDGSYSFSNGSNDQPPARRSRPKGSGTRSANGSSDSSGSSSSSEAVKREALRCRKRACSKKIRVLHAERVRDSEHEVASLEG